MLYIITESIIGSMIAILLISIGIFMFLETFCIIEFLFKKINYSFVTDYIDDEGFENEQFIQDI